MQDGNSNEGKDEAKRGTIGQALLMRDTRKPVFTVAATINHSRIQSRTKARMKRRATTEYNCYLHKHTYTVLLYKTGTTHTHIYTKPQRNKSGDFPLRVESFSRDRNSEPLWRGR